VAQSLARGPLRICADRTPGPSAPSHLGLCQIRSASGTHRGTSSQRPCSCPCLDARSTMGVLTEPKTRQSQESDAQHLHTLRSPECAFERDKLACMQNPSSRDSPDTIATQRKIVLKKCSLTEPANVWLVPTGWATRDGAAAVDAFNDVRGRTPSPFAARRMERARSPCSPAPCARILIAASVTRARCLWGIATGNQRETVRNTPRALAGMKLSAECEMLRRLAAALRTRA
jgi:hypothetical protein